jgi:hypothetical protein
MRSIIPAIGALMDICSLQCSTNCSRRATSGFGDEPAAVAVKASGTVECYDNRVIY